MAAQLYAAAASAGLQIWAAHEQARMIEANAEFQNQISKLNQEMAKIDEAEIYRQGEAQKIRQQAELDQTKDAQTAILASQGVSSPTGSTADLIAQSDLNASLNSLDLEKQIQNSAAQFRREAQQSALQANVNYASEMNRARATRISGYTSAAGTGAEAAGKYYGKGK